MGEMISFASNGSDAGGYLAVPANGSGAAVLVIQEWWGLNPQIKRTADRLADEGFVALAPDLYHGELAGHDEMDKAGQLMTELPAERAARDMSGAIDALLAHDAVTSDSVGVIGFCMGGMLTFLIAAERGDVVKAAAPYYGFPAGDGEPDWSKVTATIRGHMADPDDFFPADAARALETKLKDMGKDVQLTVHQAGHAFMNEDDVFGSHQSELAANCWADSMALFRDTLA